MPWLLLLACAPVDGPPPCESDETGVISLPADDAPHSDPDEEWAWSGHVEDEDGAWYGYSLRWRVSRDGVQETTSVQASVTNVEGQTYHYETDTASEDIATGGEGFQLALGSATAHGGDGTDALTLTAGPYTLTLSLEEAKPAAVHHGDGHTSFEVGGETTAYSRTRMLTTGTVRQADNTRSLTGISWFDHQWGDLASVDAAGSDQFALSLADGFEYQLLLVHDDGEPTLTAGSWIDPGCAAIDIDESAVAVTALDTWTSPWSGCTYPQGWTVQILDKLYTLDAELPDQEIVGAGDSSSWQGVATVVGPITGRAAVRLSGYCD